IGTDDLSKLPAWIKPFNRSRQIGDTISFNDPYDSSKRLFGTVRNMVERDDSQLLGHKRQKYTVDLLFREQLPSRSGLQTIPGVEDERDNIQIYNRPVHFRFNTGDSVVLTHEVPSIIEGPSDYAKMITIEKKLPGV
ncbi:unnamed protein product, partial [Amoebophrya sp. A25]